MYTGLLAAAAMAAGPTALKLKPTEASLFKNGFAVVVRETALGASGEYVLEELPVAVLGTLWITASDGVKLREVIVGTEKGEVRAPVGSIDEILQANVGKNLNFLLGDRRAASGKLVAVTGGICIIEHEPKPGQRQTWALNKGSIVEVSSDGELIWHVARPTSKRVLRFQAETPGKGKLYIVSLERGASWAPAYSVDIADKKLLRLVSKATILNDTLDLDRIEVRLVTGFPNIPFLPWLDPFTSGQSLQDFANSLMGMGTRQQLRDAAGFPGPAGGMAQNRLAEKSFDDAFEVSQLPGVTAEDLFFYRLPNVRLRPGERGYYVLFGSNAEYRHIYEWDIADTIQDTNYVGKQNQPNDVWHSLKFKNTSGQPLTTAAATVMKDGEILGQDMMGYTSAGAEATVRITKALDVRAEDDEEEASREREFLKIRSGHYDKVTLKGTLQIQNRKSEDVTIEVTKVLTGEIAAAEGKPKQTTLAKGLRAVNPRQRLEWKIDLKPGEKKTVIYTYTVFISG